MTTRAKVAVLRTKPETVLEDYARLYDLAEVTQHLDQSAPTILKDNISWHFPFPAANTTPWQMEGTIRALRDRGFSELACVQNRTVVTNAFKGTDLNGYWPICRGYEVPVLFNFLDRDMKWVRYHPKAKMHVLHNIFPEGIRIPDYFEGKNIVHLPTTKCVAGDTEVVLADGSLVTVRDLVRGQQATATQVLFDDDGDSRVEGQVELFALDPQGAVRPLPATSFWRTAPRGRRVLRLRTRTGRTITASADHPMRTPAGWTPLGELASGSRVAIARRIQVDGISQPLPRPAEVEVVAPVVARAGRRYTAAFSQRVIDRYQAGSTATVIADDAGIPWQSVQAILKRHDVPIRGNVRPLRVPERTSPAFWRWVGYVLAEGCIERGGEGGSDKLWWVNNDPGIRDDFIILTRELFGLEAKEHANGKHIYVYSRNLGRFIESLGLPVPLNSGNKRVPALLFRCPDEEIAAFLSAYLDGDGTVSGKQAELSAVTKSERLARDLQVLFSRLGAVAFLRPVQSTIPGVWQESRTYYQVAVSGEGFVRLWDQIRFRHPEKRRRYDEQYARFGAGRQPSNWDVTPLPRDVFRRVREGLGLTHSTSGKPSSVNTIENGHGQPTPRVARYFVNLFTEHDTDGRFHEEIASLRALTSDDLAWDEVASIEEVHGEEVELFDLTVPDAGSFVGNGLIAHNCHIYTTTTGAMKNAFGGLLNHHRHYTHTWIHETLVDLLAIQKEIHPGVFAAMDGTTAGNGPGPRVMFPEQKDVILASADQVAIDAVAAKMMGFDPMSLKYIAMAHADGLGVGDPREIEIVGHPQVAQENWGFKVGRTFHSTLGWLAWYGPTRRLQKLIFHTPLVHATNLVSETYHDYYRWTFRDRRTFEVWRRNTQWGRLFTRYRKVGTLAPPIGVGRQLATAGD